MITFSIDWVSSILGICIMLVTIFIHFYVIGSVYQTLDQGLKTHIWKYYITKYFETGPKLLLSKTLRRLLLLFFFSSPRTMTLPPVSYLSH
jgi:hypothetical protein